ncbi:MAG: MFS transporter [Chloroflexi bacterium]|nr:MFS transporter [Chloroflexota bacterium]
MRQIRNISTFESLKLRDFRLLWLGQMTTSMGQWMDQTSRTWLIYSMTNSPLQLGLISAARGLPMLFFGLLAGVVADRYGRKKQLIIAQVVNAILNLILATLILTGRIQGWHIYVTAFLAGTVQAFQQPARQVLINDLVGEKRLLNAIALNSAALNVSRSVGPAVCGLIIQAFGVDVSYYTQAALFALATVWTAQIKVPELPESAADSGLASQSFLSSVKEGFAYIATHRLILGLMVLGLAPILLGMPYQSLMPVFAIDVLHGGASTQGLLLSSVGVGAVIGALTMASLGRKQGNGRLLIGGAAGFGLSLVLFSRAPVLQMAMFFAFLAGLSNSAYNSQNQTIIQVLTPFEMRGRVLSVYLLDRGIQPVGSLIAGALASLLGGPWAVTIMGVSCMLLVVGVAIFVPNLRKSQILASSAEAVKIETTENFS